MRPSFGSAAGKSITCTITNISEHPWQTPCSDETTAEATRRDGRTSRAIRGTFPP